MKRNAAAARMADAGVAHSGGYRGLGIYVSCQGLCAGTITVLGLGF